MVFDTKNKRLYHQKDFDGEWAISFWENGKIHRIDKPAMYSDGDALYYERGNCHRINGPAILYGDGSAAIYTNGEYVGLFDEV